jgi:long-chain fatty acid transport protein
VGIASSFDSLAAATNPAGILAQGNRLDIGASLLRPDRGAEIVGNQYGANGSYRGNDRRAFVIPEVGYTRTLSPDVALGLAIYGNGGMNTDYGRNPYGAFGSKGSAGVNLSQLFISPALAYQIVPGQVVGIAANLAYQQFSAKGLSAFQPSSQSPSQLSDNGTDSATGAGVRLGWAGRGS